MKKFFLQQDDIVQYFIPQYFNTNTNQWESTVISTDLKKYRSYSMAFNALRRLKEHNKCRIITETLKVQKVDIEDIN